ncbi:MAG: CAP domain-containing protein [Burkholderiaceae bacterium]
MLSLSALSMPAASQALDAAAGTAASAAAQAALALTDPDNPVRGAREQAIARTADLLNNIRARLDACGEHGMLAQHQQAAAVVEEASNTPAIAAEANRRPPLQWNARLANAAADHARAMAEQQFFAHRDPKGHTVGHRVSVTGYRWQQVGENLAAGHETIEDAVRGWLLSTTHCEVIIDETFTEFGIARMPSANPADPYRTYWALVVAQPRR